jgi:hypothetical protein
MAEHKVCKCVYDYPDAQFASGMKVSTVKENRQAEQRGPTGVHQRKMETSLPTSKEDICPLEINIRFNKKDDLLGRWLCVWQWIRRGEGKHIFKDERAGLL